MYCNKIRNLSLIFTFWIIVALPVISSAFDKGDSSKSGLRMGFFDLNIGPDFRYFRGTYTSDSIRFINHAYLVTSRMQHSFLGNYILDNGFKRLRFGDVLAGEISPGIILEKTTQSTTPGIAYRFEFGAGAIVSINNKNEIGLTLTLLKFARDRVSPNISGSNILLRYRYGRVVTEAGIEARRDRIFGWLIFFNKGNKLPVQYSYTTRYLIDDKKNIGMRLEIMTGQFGRSYVNDRLILRSLWSVRLFYGIYF